MGLAENYCDFDDRWTGNIMSLTNEDITKITDAIRPMLREEFYHAFEPRLSNLQQRLSSLLERVANCQKI